MQLRLIPLLALEVAQIYLLIPLRFQLILHSLQHQQGGDKYLAAIFQSQHNQLVDEHQVVIQFCNLVSLAYLQSSHS